MKPLAHAELHANAQVDAILVLIVVPRADVKRDAKKLNVWIASAPQVNARALASNAVKKVDVPL